MAQRKWIPEDFARIAQKRIAGMSLKEIALSESITAECVRWVLNKKVEHPEEIPRRRSPRKPAVGPDSKFFEHDPYYKF